MSRQIAVLMCTINADNQCRMLEGMIDAAKETDSNLYVFTNYISYREKEENLKGAYQILGLPDYREFDGVIIAKNTITYPQAAEAVTRAVLESGCPAVSIDVEIEGMSHISFSSYEAEYAMTEHFIREHHCSDIYYISGPLFHKEGQKRYRGFLDAMEKNGLKIRQDHICQGFFTMDSGMQAVETFLKDGERPRAIICGNDAMAVGAQEALRQHGLRVPEDVILAGFDNSELSELSYPPLTSVDKNQHEVGYRAVYEIMSRVEGSPPNGTAVAGEPILRTSCGCPFEEEQNARKLRESYVHNQISTQNGADILRNMITEFSGLGTPEDVVEALKKYVEQMEFESFYLCFCEKDRLFAIQDETLTGALDILHGNTEYTDMIHIPLAYENGVFGSYENFPRGKVLPEECRTKSGGNYYVAVPVFYQHCCYGYCISGNTHLPLEHNFFYAWIMNIGIGFENIRKRVLLEDTVKRLNSMWAYDMLTRLYNRAGFFHYAERMLRDLQQEDEYVCLVFLDLDGLKQVNDTIGHEAGDELIGSMAEIIRQNIEEGSLAMRYGGDEFVILGRCAGEGITERFVAALREGMQRRNRRSNTSYELRASIGVSRYRARDIESLDLLIGQADQKMYEEKRMKRRMRDIERQQK